jgi:ribosome-binding factor A
MSDRMRRVNSVLRETIAAEVERLKDPRIGFLTITGVKTASNLRTAVVHYSVIGTSEEAAGAQDALDAAAPYVSRNVGGKIAMKFTPSLRFEVDESIERGTRISTLIRDAQQEDEAHHVDEDDEFE